MPIYNYKCASCGAEKEVMQKFTDAAPECSKLEHGQMTKQLNASYGFTFKRGKGTSGGDSMRMPTKQPNK